MKRIFLLICGLFTFLTASSGQEAAVSSGQEVTVGRWDGNVELNAGSSFAKGKSTSSYSFNSGGISGWGRYSTDKFMIRMDVQCLSNFSATSVSGITINVKDQKAPKADIDLSQNEKSVFEESTGLTMEYTPDSQNAFSFKLKQKLNRQTPNKIVVSLQNVFFGEEPEDVRTHGYFDIEEVRQKVAEYSAEANWSHKYDKPGRDMNARIGWTLNQDDKASTWNRFARDKNVFDEDMEALTAEQGTADRIFRITPFKAKNSLNASAIYRDTDLFGLESLNLELGAVYSIEYENDKLSAANYEHEVWVDSLKYRETFDFLMMDLSPRIKLTYSPGRFHFNMQLTPDFYVSRLSSEGLTGPFNYGKVFLLPDLNADWTPSSKHKIGISYKQGLSRPTYLQTCWFPRAGEYANEIVVGNPKLKPASNGKAALSYTFHSGFFTGTLEGSTTMNWDKIEKVIKSADEYRVSTWINSGRSTDSRIKLTMKADLKNFQAELGGYWNYFLGYNNAGKETRSSDWGMDASARLRLKGGWLFDVKGRYQSKIIRTYSTTTKYIGCDVRITKDFKKFSVYAEGKDLFDRPITTTTYSEDKTYARFEQHTNNRRIFSIGASFKF